jgi:hypothetical protein
MRARCHLRWIIVAGLGTVCAASWLAVCVGFFVRFSLRIWTVIVSAAAISTEALLWVMAAALGVAVIQARHRLWASVVKPLRKRG